MRGQVEAWQSASQLTKYQAGASGWGLVQVTRDKTRPQVQAGAKGGSPAPIAFGDFRWQLNPTTKAKPWPNRGTHVYHFRRRECAIK